MNRYLLVDGNNLAGAIDDPAYALGHLFGVILLFVAAVALAAWVVKLVWRRRK